MGRQRWRTAGVLLTILAAATVARGAEAKGKAPARRPSNSAGKPEIPLWPVGKAPGQKAGKPTVRRGWVNGIYDPWMAVHLPTKQAEADTGDLSKTKPEPDKPDVAKKKPEGGKGGGQPKASQRARRYWEITELQARQFNDDLDYLLLYERNSRLKGNGAAVVVCPGGGYAGLACDHEGVQIGKWLNSLGVAAFVLRYRHRPHRHPIPLADAQRAIRIVRSRAKQWGIDPAKIGIMGFSAGGHLAASATTHFDAGKPDAPDPIDRVSCRPDFSILIYPVISMKKGITHGGSRGNLLGPSPDEKLVALMSNELQVTARTPPTFLVHATSDRVVVSANSTLFHAACKKAGVPCELRLYKQGGHGFGLGRKGHDSAEWPTRCADWLKARKLLDRK